MTRRYGRARRGQRVKSYTPHGHWNTTTMIGSIRLDGTTTCMAVNGSTNAEVWREYIRQVLCPSLKQGDVVIADNLSAHKDILARDLIEACSARLEFLPPCSPDLNPIEKMWSKIKAYLRGVEARTFYTLIEAIGQAFDFVVNSDAEGYFFHVDIDFSIVKDSICFSHNIPDCKSACRQER